MPPKNGYFSYHGAIRKLLTQNKLLFWYFTDDHNGIAPALVLVFDDAKHPVMPVRREKWNIYLPLLPKNKRTILRP